jgi:hypothetical protein
MKRWMGWMLAVAVVMAPNPAAAKKPEVHALDKVWERAGLDTTHVESIAMLPAAAFDGNLQNEKTVEGMLARALRGAGYRWLSTASTRVRLRSAASDDSLLHAVRDQTLENVGVDSLTAIAVCALLRSDAVLSIRVDRFEQVKLEPGQNGKPSTTVQAKAALVDANGQTLWTISGSEVGEGPLQSSDRDPTRLPNGGVNINPSATGPGPPSFDEVLTKLFDRWAARFPARVQGKAE